MEFIEEPPTQETLLAYGHVPISFMVETQYVVESIQGSVVDWSQIEAPVEPSYLKDYDALPGNAPSQWIDRFDVFQWGVFSAFDNQKRVGGAVVISDTADHNMDEGPSVAILWDMRVQPDCRRSGIGSRLIAQAVAWARGRNCTALKVETQNINVPACKFYARMGFQLRAVNPHAYPSLPNETQLLWYQDL